MLIECAKDVERRNLLKRQLALKSSFTSVLLTCELRVTPDEDAA